METNTRILIEQVGNGFIVREDASDYRRGEAMPTSEGTRVFQSMAGMVEFMQQHFEHRDKRVTSDKTA